MRSTRRTILGLVAGLLACLVALALGAASVSARRAAGPTFTIIDLGALGGSWSQGVAINSLGQVAGRWITSDGTAERSFFWDGRSIHDIGDLGEGQALATGINGAGHISGESSLAGGEAQYFIWDGTTMHDLVGWSVNVIDGLGGINDLGQVAGNCRTADPTESHACFWDGSAARDIGTLQGFGVSSGAGINNLGDMTGSSWVFDPGLGMTVNHAFFWNGSTMQDLGTLGRMNSGGVAINASGEIAGTVSGSLAGLLPRAFLWDGVSMHELDASFGTNCAGLGINAAAQVVGNCANSFTSHAILWDGPSTWDLNDQLVDMGAWTELTSAQAINDRGQITGYGLIGGQHHAFLLTPVAPSRRTFLVSFTGFGDAPSLTNMPPTILYPPGKEENSLGMVNLLANVRRLLPSVISQAFTFYTAGDGDQFHAPLDASLEHPEAYTWLTKTEGFVPGVDQIVIAGHSYGGHRARLFADEVYSRLGVSPDQLILVDPIDWTKCRLSQVAMGRNAFRWLPGGGPPACDLSRVEETVSAPIPVGSAITYRQVGWFLSGYALAGHPDVVLDSSHFDIDDDERVQRGIINAVQAGTLTAPAVTLAVSIVPEPGPFNIRWTMTIQNTGKIDATNFDCAILLNQRISPGTSCDYAVHDFLMRPGDIRSVTFYTPTRPPGESPARRPTNEVEITVTANGRPFNVSRPF